MPHGMRWALAALLMAGLLAGAWLCLRTRERELPVTADSLVSAAGGGSAPEVGAAPVEDASRAETRSAVARTSLDPAGPRHWAVRVRTSFGVPAVGFPVRFLTRPTETALFSQELRVRETGPDGGVVLRIEELPAGLWGQQLSAQVPCIGGSVGTPWLVARAWPLEPLVVDLPPVVTVRAAVCDPDGLPAREAGRVRLDCLRDGERFASVSDAYASGEAVAVFPRVPADAAMELRVVQGANERALEKLSGPFMAGTEVQVTLRCSTLVTTLVGRLADVDGKPLPKQVFQCSLHPLVGKRQDEESRTGEGGEFRLLLPAGWRDQPLDRLVFSVGSSNSLLQRAAGPEPGERLARILAPGRIEARQTDLGVVRLRALELLAAGTVEDERGDPIHGAGPWLHVADGQDPLERVMLRVYTVLQHFQVVGFSLPADAGLLVLPGPYRALAPLSVRPGAHDHRLVVVRSGEVALTASIHPGPGVGVVLQRLDDQRTFVPHRSDIVDGTTLSANWYQLTPGRHALLFRRGPSSAFEVVLPDLLIEEGPRCSDPRLRALDLRSRQGK